MAREAGAAGSRPPLPAPRPRYRRIGAAVGSFAVTAVAVLGGLGVLPSQQAASSAAEAPARGATGQGGTMALSDATSASVPPGVDGSSRSRVAGSASSAGAGTDKVPAVPAGSGEGKRVVFDITAQRVWLVSAKDKVLRTYLVSGSVTDNLQPGHFRVYSRSLHAVGIDDSGAMDYMVRFTRGDNAAIGFHDIPVKDGHLVQGRDQLGTPQSHGCIRQWRPDAKALWAFAPVGTDVVVV